MVLALETRDYVLTIEPDTDTENPLTSCDGMWTVYTWQHKRYSLLSDTDRDTFFPQSETTGKYAPTLAIRNKLRAGTAFLIKYREHGLSRYSLWHGDLRGSDGIIVWENPVGEMGAKTPEDREEDAALCLETYTEWANGSCFWYSLVDADTDEQVDSCGGLIGYEETAEAIVEYSNMAEMGPMRVKVTGTAADIAEMYRTTFPANVVFVKQFSDDGADGEIDEY